MKKSGKLTKALLMVERLTTAPAFFVSWFCCALIFAIKSGYLISRLETREKEVVLNTYFGGNE